LAGHLVYNRLGGLDYVSRHARTLLHDVFMPHRTVRSKREQSELIKAMFLILAATLAGLVVGYAIAWGTWEINHPGHASENVTGNYWGMLLGSPAGGIIGFIIGAVFAMRWFRHASLIDK